MRQRLRELAALPWLLAMRALDRPFRLLQRGIGQGGMPYFFLVPNLLFFGTFVILPLLVNAAYSLTGGTELFLEDRPWIGAEHFGHLFACGDLLDPATCREDNFWRAIYNSMKFVTLQVGFMVALSLLTALVLNRKIRARGFFRAVFFFPVLLSPVVVALIWKWVLHRDGVLNALLESLGGDKILFFIDPGWAMFWAIFVSIWAHMGFYTLILLAGLQAIPPDLYEAAEMDGTSKTRTLWRITLPMLWPNLVVVIVLAMIKSVQTFDEVFVLTGGGPGTATQLIVQYIYDTGFASQVQNFGLAAAASYVLAVILIALTVIYIALAFRPDAKHA
ncbi:MAG: sugar ABC transporter permease [Betaproteobacteria bacterium AqS2]|uniref:Sugar ABC transporter permease n=1 Tax=Candidatus Amphirhobacter heronislandensis TaxID=1732024 RepID=A0A930UI38_9GAMM|nr:sugar ABC transporter permease [Betaproteobacteria bacterium AqS2]